MRTLRSLRQFLSDWPIGLHTRNPWGAGFDQTPPHLADGILARIPGPMQPGQWHCQYTGRNKLQDHLPQGQKQRPAPDAWATAALIVRQTQLFHFIDVDLNLIPAILGTHRLLWRQFPIGSQQIPRRQLQPRHDDNDDTHGQGTSAPHTPQQDLRVPQPDMRSRPWTRRTIFCSRR